MNGPYMLRNLLDLYDCILSICMIIIISLSHFSKLGVVGNFQLARIILATSIPSINADCSTDVKLEVVSKHLSTSS